MGPAEDQAPLMNAGQRIHVLHVLEATAGGTRRHLRDLAGGLDPARYRVSVVVSPRRDPDFSRDMARFRAQGMDVHVVGMWRRPAPLHDLLATARLFRLFRLLRPDVVHAHSSKAGFLARVAARAAGVPVTIYTPHAFSWDMTVGALPQRGFRALEQMAVPWTDRLIAVSTHERQLALDLGFAPSQVVLIPNGVPETNDRIGEGGARCRRDAGGPIIGFVGRLCLQKAPDLFLAAVPRILAARPDARFLMVAETGPWYERTIRHVNKQSWRDQIVWGSAHDEWEVAAHLSRMDVLLMPSRWEGLPYTLLEAMDAGVPVVASRVGGITDVLTDPVDGLLLPVGDAGAMAAGVVRLLGDEGCRCRMVAAARQRVKAFSLTAMINRTSAVYEDALACKSAAGRIRCRPA
jgi:glycosyltransferase involved in cell wall biosynthesis